MIERVAHGDVALLRFCAGKVNALDVEFCQAIARELEATVASGARAVVLTGKGNVFSAGVDLFRVVNEGEAYVDRFLPALDEAFSALFCFPLPLIAAVNGHAIAGGGVIAAACDHRVMARGPFRIGVPELAVGVPFPALALEILRHAMSPPTFQRAVYLAETFEPEQALELGIVDRLEDAEQLEATALRLGESLAKIPSASYAVTKSASREPALANVERARSSTEPEVVRRWRDPETRAAIRDYLERTLGRSR